MVAAVAAAATVAIAAAVAITIGAGGYFGQAICIRANPGITRAGVQRGFAAAAARAHAASGGVFCRQGPW